jgi:DsbC/DsbD-like thiol-disulfide interchange protein
MPSRHPAAALVGAMLILGSPLAAQPAKPAEISTRITDLPAQGRTNLEIQVDLEKGWKTYYKNQEPYDTEMRLHWKGETAEAVATHEILWPEPESFDFYGEEITGYADEVTFPVEIIWKEGARPDTLSFDLEIYFCSNLCIREEIPYEISLSSHELRLPWSDQSSSSSSSDR